jgi:hypothetical protein
MTTSLEPTLLVALMLPEPDFLLWALASTASTKFL